MILVTARGSYTHLTYQIGETADNINNKAAHHIEQRATFLSGTPCENRTHN